MRWHRVCFVALIFISANPTSARSLVLVGHEQREQSGTGVDGEQPSVHVDLEVSGRLSSRRITSDKTFAKAADGGASVAVTCRGVDDCGGGAGAEVTSSPDKDAAGASSTISEGNHDDAEHEVATRPGVASTADFFAGGAIQTNLPNVASSESVAAATSGAQQEQAAGDVSAAFSPESISELLAQLEARKKEQDDDRLCNTEKEQVSTFNIDFSSNTAVTYRILSDLDYLFPFIQQSLSLPPPTLCYLPHRSVTNPVRTVTIVPRRVAMRRKNASKCAEQSAARQKIRTCISSRRIPSVLVKIRRGTTTIVAREARRIKRRRSAAV